jgi:hypothetical protein
MNDDKFATTGEKLNVNSTELIQEQQNFWTKKVGFFIAQFIVLAVSSLSGILFGMTDRSQSYPFMSVSGAFGGMSILAINGVNYKTIVKRSSMGDRIKIRLFLASVLLSIGVFMFSYLSAMPPPSSSDVPIYGIYSREKEGIEK